MSDRTFILLVWVYGIGLLIDWSYWISVGWETDSGVDHVGPTLFGWGAALFWPLHAGSEIWQWVLS